MMKRIYFLTGVLLILGVRAAVPVKAGCNGTYTCGFYNNIVCNSAEPVGDFSCSGNSQSACTGSRGRQCPGGCLGSGSGGCSYQCSLSTCGASGCSATQRYVDFAGTGSSSGCPDNNGSGCYNSPSCTAPTNTPVPTPPGCVPGSCNTSGCSTTACGQPCGSNGCTTCSTGTSGCTGDNLPKGYHDVPTNADCQLHGWTCDPDRYSQALLVDFWQGGTYVGQDTAQDFSEDGVNAACGNTPNHRFSYTLPLAYQDGNPHTITAFGIGINSSGGLVGGSGNTPLTNSTQTITCAPPPTPTPCLAPANPTGLSPSSNPACGTTS